MGYPHLWKPTRWHSDSHWARTRLSLKRHPTSEGPGPHGVQWICSAFGMNNFVHIFLVTRRWPFKIWHGGKGESCGALICKDHRCLSMFQLPFQWLTWLTWLHQRSGCAFAILRAPRGKTRRKPTLGVQNIAVCQWRYPWIDWFDIQSAAKALIAAD